jgi:ATPase subunit of ABC transporter with duplicated ATPase domains
VLWLHSTGTPFGDTWYIERTDTTKKECRDQVESRKALFKGQASALIAGDRVILSGKNKAGKDTASSMEFSCLPDTVDPRGPKGK